MKFNDAMNKLYEDGGYIYMIDGEFYQENEQSIVVEVCGMDDMRDTFDDDTIATIISMEAMQQGGMTIDEINEEVSSWSANVS